MSVSDYLNKDENILFQFKIQTQGNIGKKIIRSDHFGLTEKRLFHIQNLSHYARIYTEIPLSKISYIKNSWYDRDEKKFVIGVTFLLLGMLTFYLTVGFAFIFLGLYYILRGLKHGGLFIVNDKKWKYKFYEKASIHLIEDLIKKIYSVVGSDQIIRK